MATKTTKQKLRNFKIVVSGKVVGAVNARNHHDAIAIWNDPGGALAISYGWTPRANPAAVNKGA
jgi:hypothetical protein